MIDAVNVATQSVAANAPIVFGSTRICTGCSARHEQGSSRFTLLKPGIYQVTFNANVSLPAGATVAPIIIDIVQDGEPVAGARAIYTPAAAETVGTVSVTTLIRVYCDCCVPVGVRNSTAQTINIQDANVAIMREC